MQIYTCLAILVGVSQCIRPWSPLHDGLIGNLPRMKIFLRNRPDNNMMASLGSRKDGLVKHYELPEGWANCGTDEDIWQFELMALSPNPPQRNHNATIRVAGTLLEPVEGNVKVDYLLKYGALPIVRDVIDACELVKDFPSLPQCPLKAGRYDVSYEDLIPFQTPMGTYTISAKGFIPQPDGSKKPVFCVEGVVIIKLFNPSTMQFVNELNHPYSLDN